MSIPGGLGLGQQRIAISIKVISQHEQPVSDRRAPATALTWLGRPHHDPISVDASQRLQSLNRLDGVLAQFVKDTTELFLLERDLLPVTTDDSARPSLPFRADDLNRFSF